MGLKTPVLGGYFLPKQEVTGSKVGGHLQLSNPQLMSATTLLYLENCLQNDEFFIGKNAQFLSTQFSTKFDLGPPNGLF